MTVKDSSRSAHWVLVSDGANGDTRDCVVAIRALAQAGYSVAVTVRSSNAMLSKYVGRRVLVEGDIVEHTRKEIQSGAFSAFIPAGEDVVLDAPQSLLNKVTMSSRAGEVGLSVPEQVVFPGPSDLVAEAFVLPYPVVVKPAVRSFKPFRVDGPSEMAGVVLPEGEVIVQPFLRGNMSAVAGVMWDSEVHSSSAEMWHRIWPLDCGLAAWAVTIPPSERLEGSLAALMAGYSGLFVAQFVDGRLIDLNLRVHSSLPLAVKAGANLAAIYADLVRGLRPRRRRAAPGKTYRWISGDVKGVLTSVRSGTMSAAQALRALTPVPGTVHSMVSLRDPMPMVARLAARLPRHG